MFIGDIYRKAEVEISRRLTGAYPRLLLTDINYRYKSYDDGYEWETVSEAGNKRTQEKVHYTVPGHESDRLIARRVRTPDGHRYKMHRIHIHRMDRGYDKTFTESGRRILKKAAIVEHGENGGTRVSRIWYRVERGILPVNNSLFTLEEVHRTFDRYEKKFPSENGYFLCYTDGQTRRNHYSYSLPRPVAHPDANATAQPR